MPNLIRKATAVVKAVESGGEHGEFEVVLSTPTRDRDGDEVRTEEWETPLPEHITFDIDHGMSVATTVGSGVPTLDEDGRLIVRGTFASTDLAQTTRTLVTEGHIRTTSVAFLEKKTRVEGRAVTRRELLNGAFVPIPANPEAVIVSSKSAAEAIDAETEQAQVKAMVKALAGSYEERQQAIYVAVEALYEEDWRTWAYLRGTTDTTVVWHVWSKDEDVRGDYEATYTLDADMNVTLGDPVKVRVVEVVTALIDSAPDPESTKSAAPGQPPASPTPAVTDADGDPDAEDDAAALEAQEKAKAIATARANFASALTLGLT